MTLTQLEHVREAHKAGSFSAAARTCGVTQAALSNSIAKLEEELGERIFSRTTRRVTLSPFGATLLPYVEQILAGRDALVTAAKAQQTPPTTVIGHSPLIPSHVLTQMVGAIRDARFGSEIRLIEENLSDLLQRLSEHTIDIALIPEAKYPSSIRSAPVCEDPLFYVARRSRDTKADEAELEEHRRGHVRDGTRQLWPRTDDARSVRVCRCPASRICPRSHGLPRASRVGGARFLGSAILPQSRLAAGTHAVPLLRAPGVPALLTYRVAWHSEYARGLGPAVSSGRRRSSTRIGESYNPAAHQPGSNNDVEPA